MALDCSGLLEFVVLATRRLGRNFSFALGNGVGARVSRAESFVQEARKVEEHGGYGARGTHNITMDPEAFLDLANQVTKLKMFPYFDIAHSVLCALHVREDLGPDSGRGMFELV
ncbi:Trimeric intracellular cation channel type B [Homalodisca vitripennis]|nr:Trimeric intracellular cation channel type B [Homalodisca vitripennis]